MKETLRASPSAAALRSARAGDWPAAELILSALIGEVFGLGVVSLSISRDKYSLNSLNGFVEVMDGRRFFYKFHHEEGEEVTLEEFYRAEILKEAGYPIDMPIYISREIGRQLLMYEVRTTPRLSDLCDRLEFDPSADLAPVLAAQAALDDLTCAIYRRTLHSASPGSVAAEPINQLFYHRLVDGGQPDRVGGRAKSFFWGRTFELAGVTMAADDLREAHWVVNGVRYRDTIGDLLARSRSNLHPHALARFGTVTAHGDAHNANIWWEADPARLVFFDPAFAGSEVSAILAEVKASFHNILAHPLWLYDPKQATERYRVAVRRAGDDLEVETDWKPSPLREAFLALKADHLWRPLLALMKQRGLLPPDWRETLRCGLFCCPALVMDLCAGGTAGHTPQSSTIGLSVAVMVGSEPDKGGDLVSEFLDHIDPDGVTASPTISAH